MSIRFTDDIWILRIQLFWVMYTLVYILCGNYIKSAFISSLLITIGGGLIALLLLHNLKEKDTEKINNIVYIALISWAFLIEKSVNEHNDYLGGVFALVYAFFIGWLLWMRHSNPFKKYLKYTVFLVLFVSAICSFTQLFVTVGIKSIDHRFFTASEYYIIGHHGFGTAVGLIASLWFGARLLPQSLPDNDLAHQGMNTRFHCIVLLVILILGVFFGNEKRLLAHFESNAIWFSVIYSVVYVFSLIYCISFCLKSKGTTEILRRIVMISIFYPIFTSLVASLVIWNYSLLSAEQNFLNRWLIFEYLPTITFSLVFLASIIAARRLSSHVVCVKLPRH